MKLKFKIIGTILISGFFLIAATGSGETENKQKEEISKEEEKKAQDKMIKDFWSVPEKEVQKAFKNCDELLEYVQYESTYYSLTSGWGKGNVGEPWDASSIGEFDMQVIVEWNNVKCNGKPVSLRFENNYTSDPFEKSPGDFIAVDCSEFE